MTLQLVGAVERRPPARPSGLETGERRRGGCAYRYCCEGCGRAGWTDEAGDPDWRVVDDRDGYPHGCLLCPACTVAHLAPSAPVDGSPDQPTEGSDRE